MIVKGTKTLDQSASTERSEKTDLEYLVLTSAIEVRCDVVNDKVPVTIEVAMSLLSKCSRIYTETLSQYSWMMYVAVITV